MHAYERVRCGGVQVSVRASKRMRMRDMQGAVGKGSDRERGGESPSERAVATEDQRQVCYSTLLTFCDLHLLPFAPFSPLHAHTIPCPSDQHLATCGLRKIGVTEVYEHKERLNDPEERIAVLREEATAIIEAFFRSHVE